ncbi:unnamed protein product [Linum trigynum]|uniref:Aminotransferase-like plant mobile domain-containing protein n=1 Tax=Linum trigynum TaxID=586398 RepID=A0AAV2FJ38_9ROSI
MDDAGHAGGDELNRFNGRVVDVSARRKNKENKRSRDIGHQSQANLGEDELEAPTVVARSASRASGSHGRNQGAASRVVSAEFDEDDSDEDIEVPPPTRGHGRVSSRTATSRPAMYRDRAGRFVPPARQETESSGTGRSRGGRSSGPPPWELVGECPGGPTDPSLIRSFRGHVAYALWTGAGDRGVISCYSRTSAVAYLSSYVFSHVEAENLVQQSGLQHLMYSMFRRIAIDDALISAFVERWQPDTNTFHLPFGEMTILLHDVQYLLQIPVEGRLMSRSSAQLDHPEAGLCALLGMNSEQLSGRTEVPGYNNRGKWYEKGGFLAEMASRYLQSHGTHVTEAQSYLLLLLGSTLFVDKSRDRVRSVVNLFLDELEELDQYSWASGTLAWLYRYLGQASRAGARGMAGCLTLLQCWIYEYFPGFRPSHFEPAAVGPDDAWASRWIGQPAPGSVADPSVRLAFYRRALDSLTPSDVFWTPFHQRPHQAVRRSLYTGVIRFADIGEFYDPARCLRQFGYVQMVPPAPSRPQRADRPEAPGGYVIRIPESFDAAWEC